jgi:outer membrane receptor protein involved in Fe transport
MPSDSSVSGPPVRLRPLLAALFPAGLFAAETPVSVPVALAPVVVTASRLPQDPATLPLTVETYSAATLRNAPALTLDDTLRRSAAFSLFRRTGSLTANPTAQGVSLRGIGPSGASRALVLLDGVPVNDPFGGWVTWSKLPLNALDRVELVRGGGSSAWGGSSLGGVIHLHTAPALPPQTPQSVTKLVTDSEHTAAVPSRSAPRKSVTNLVTLGSAGIRATSGDFSTRAADLSATFATDSGRDAFRIDAASFATDGVRLVRNPGPVDMPADSRHTRGGLAWQRRISETTTLSASSRAWTEERGNGTPYQQNASEEFSASTTLAGAPTPGPAWSFTLYGQQQDFRSTFSAVNPARTAETPASDQYSVPSTAAGASLQFTWGDAADLASGAGSATTLGLDARHVDGETREYFFFDAPSDSFLRERRAGGAQTVAGLFATHARPLAPDLNLNLGARLDATRRTGGFLRETVRATSAVLTDTRFANRDDLAFSPSLGLAWRATETLTARAAAYSAYRTPTLNELYRPFRIGAITTRANPALDPETLLGGELGLAYAAPDARLGLRATVFQNELSDAVGNVTLDATTRQRRNLDSTRIRGLELGGHWNPDFAETLRFEIDYLLSDARVRSGGPGAASLDGKRLAQVPRHTVTAGLEWRAARATTLDLRSRWTSSQFEDDQNALRLASALRLDFAVRHALTSRLTLTVAVENLLDAEIQTARTAAGLVSVAPPRFARVELGYTW